MDSLPSTRSSKRARRGAHVRTKGAPPWWERLGEAPPGAAGGAARSRRRRIHPGLVAGAVLAVMALPLLAFTKTPSHKAKSATAKTPATQPAEVIPTEPIVTDLTTLAAPTTDATTSTEASTTSTEASTTTEAKSTSSAAARPKAVAPTTAAPAAKPVAKPSAPSPTPAPTAAPAPKPAAAPSGHSQSGQGTWYDGYPGGCASNDLPQGTHVTVTNTSNGRSTTCVVDDTGGFQHPRILDMDRGVFAQIADLGAGVIPIVVTW